MKHKKALTALVLALALFGAFNLVSYAADGLQEISAYLNSNISFKLDGEEQILKDASGVRTYPITYQGTTYVPIRSVANLLGVNVDWDQATQSILLGEPEGGVDLIDTYKAYYINEFKQVQTADKQEPMDISGKSYSHWIRLGGAPRGIMGTISFNLEGKYDTLTFTYYSNSDVTLEVLGDNDYVLAEIPIKGGQVAQTVEVKLLDAIQLTFRNAEERSTGAELYIVDAKLS